MLTHLSKITTSVFNSRIGIVPVCIRFNTIKYNFADITLILGNTYNRIYLVKGHF